MAWGGTALNFKTRLIGVKGTIKAARPRQMLFDSRVINQMNSLY
jgi:hypothetical protein